MFTNFHISVKKTVFFFFLFLPIVLINKGQEIPKYPILRIENGYHIGKLTEISIDHANRYLVTAAEDKTARIWDLSSGKLLSVLRPPIGENKDGMLYTVSISPDGNTIAVAGWTGELSKVFIYIFDRESGKLVNIIPGFREVIHKLSYSPDGKYLGATLGGRHGIRLYETESYRLVGEDSNYSASSFGLDFDSTSRRIVTSSTDGLIRLYEIKDGKLDFVRQLTTDGGKQPWDVKFSPDGSKIAIGFYQFLGVTVVSSDDLSFLYEADVSKVTKLTKTSSVYFHVVAWSADGQTLFAGGNYLDKNWQNIICEWTNDGRDYRETPASNGAVFDIEPLHTGEIVFGVAAPAGWGILDADRKRTHLVTTNSPDFRNSVVNLLVNDDASKIGFPYEVRGKMPTVFSIPERKFKLPTRTEQDLNSSLVEANGLKIDNWARGQEPTLNGNKLKLNPYETSYSLSILPNGRQFLIGTGWYLRLFNDKGEISWRTSVPGVVWRLNYSEKGKLAVAALGDGTIRWYRVSDGQEVLAFFSPNDHTERWILWTPSGYYDASPKAEDLIGWHVNNGRDQAADFFPNHLFKAYFYRPDVIDTILRTLDENLALKLANEKSRRKDEKLSIAGILPPVIEINSPKIREVETTSLKVKYKIRNHSGEAVTGIKVLIDGQEIESSGSKINLTSDSTSELTVQIPRKNSKLELIAENRYTKSLPAIIYLRWRD